MKPKSLHIHRQSRDYAAPKRVCAACTLQPQCTQNKMGRTIKRHLRQDDLERMRARGRFSQAKQDIRTRPHLMERCVARAVHYGFGRARWRQCWRVEIQEYLTTAIQNTEVLIRYGRDPSKCPAVLIRNKENTTSKVPDEFLSAQVATP